MSVKLPVQNGDVVQVTPVSMAITRHVDSTISSSTEFQLNTNTTFLRVYAISQDVYLRWGIEDCNESTFDEVIPAGQIVDLFVPATQEGPKHTHINVIERAASATVIIIEK